MRKMLVKILIAIILLAAVGIISLLSINAYVKHSSKSFIINSQQASELEADAILVLGAKVIEDRLSQVLYDRVSVGIELYELGASNNLLMSGDHGQVDYDEVNVMKNYAEAKGVPSDDVFLDHAGFSTYESMYRASEIFSAKKIVIVTQTYHLYRAIYIARAMGIEAYGVASDLRPYAQQFKFSLRELFARFKDFFYCIAKPLPKYLGDKIDLTGSAAATHDK